MELRRCSEREEQQAMLFWMEFENFHKVVVNNTREDKWEKLEEKGERRIKKHVDQLKII